MVRLEPGVTAVVGPNGCGKSNILDALRWVLGEQRAKELRGSHMQDIIFNGSEERSALGMAEVSVTFDNSDSSLPVDFAELQVTRRVYRSGESEYLINKAPCRLRDIVELFMDTGVATSAYSMIGQGKMDMVLSSKPDDRRNIFEEAAGIIKYKARKRVAMRRLDSAEQNFLRLSDIIAEVQRQMRSLKRQVNAAIRYRELSEQLREVEIRAAWLKHHDLTESIRDLRDRFRTAQNEYEKLSAEITSFEARHEELGLNRLEADRLLTSRREAVHELDTEMEKIERQIALLRQQIDFSKQQQQQAEEEAGNLSGRAESIHEQLKLTLERAEAVRAEMTTSTQDTEAKQAEHGQALETVQMCDTALEALRTQAVEKMNSRNKTATEAESLTAGLEKLDAQLNALYERQSDTTQRQEAVLAQLEQARSQETDALKNVGEVEQDRAERTKTHGEESEHLKDLESQWRELREQKSSLDARLHSLRELRDNYEGFATGVRAIMRAKAESLPQAEGVIGPIGDLISTDTDYERAIEAALGGSINNVVVEQAESAKNAVRFLKENRAGRVTFLPLDIIRGGRGKEGHDLRNRAGVIGPALDYVQFDSQVQAAVEYALHSTLVVESLDVAIAIARESKNYPRLVTLDGELVSSAGAVTGGRTRHESRGLLGRSAEIEELEKKVDTAEGEIERIGTERNNVADAIQLLAVQMRELADQESVLRRSLNELGVAIARHSTDQENLTQSAQNLDQERDSLAGQREQMENQRRDALDRQESLDQEDEAFQNEIATAQDAAAQARQALSVCASELSDIRVKQASLSQRLEECERDHQRESSEEQQARTEAERRRELIAQLEENQAHLAREIEEQAGRTQGLSESKEEARKLVVEAENKRQALLDEGDELEKTLRTKRDAVREAQSSVHTLEIDLRHDEDQLAFFQERILTEYNLALGSLKIEDVGEDEYGEKERDKLVQDLRQRLQRMGEVNLMAIEEYEELEKRSDFLVTQSEDLQTARESLLGVVERCDVKIRTMFMETFNEVADNFRKNFRRLFNGGQARVYLLDEDDPLDSGIEIEARPPGKKPTTISLLSGGERAMTAVALLFSVFEAKPSPFCVLDEVDAPLDDANIGRFLDLLEDFTKESQFVVITHSKKTMARAEALYGVTMQERGVSQLVSVKMREEPGAETAA